MPNPTEPRWYHCGRQWLVLGDTVTCEEYAAHTASCIVNFCGVLWAVLEQGGEHQLLNPKLGSVGPKAIEVKREH